MPLAEVQAHQTKGRYPLLGKVVGDRYHLIGGLGQGGLGTVYLAQHLHLGQLFAVKFLDIHTLAPETDDKNKDEYRRDFLNEARVASLIRHEAVVKVSDFGEHEGLPFLVMEYVPGPSLLQVLATKGRFEVAEALAIARRIAEALDAFHERRLVHRDLKPANVILDPRANGRLTLVDLGLVKDLSGPGGKASTHPLALRGTPGYLAPEQVPGWVLSGAGVEASGREKSVDARVDIYALGVILYEMLAGVSPYPAELGNTQIIVYACTRDPLPLSGVEPPPRLLPGLEKLVYDTMHRDPAHRPQTAADFLDRLDEVAMGTALSGSWPSIVVPRRHVMAGPGASSPASGLLPPDEPPDLPPEEDDPGLEPTAVLDDPEHLEAPARSAPFPLIAPGDEDRTIEADDSVDGLDAPDLDFDEEMGVATKVQTLRPAAPAPAPATRTAVTPAPRRRLPTWVVFFVPLLLGLGLGSWYFTREDAPLRRPPPPEAPQRDAGVVTIQFNADEPPAPDAAVAVAVVQAPPDAAPSEPDAEPDAGAEQAAPRPRRVARAAPKKNRADTLFQLGEDALRRAMKAEGTERRDLFQEALRHYRQFRSEAGPAHPRYSMATDRITALERQVKTP